MLFFYLVPKELRGIELKIHLYWYMSKLQTEHCPPPPIYLRACFENHASSVSFV